MVLCTGCLLYQTQLDDHYQTEVALPLGMVVNAVFKNEQWLYVQTPHAEEGYIPYGSCLPLGIVPPPDAARAPCWETQSDVFPRPVGDRRRRHHHRHHHHHQHRHRQRHHQHGGGGGGGAAGRADDGERDVATLQYHRRRHCGSDTSSLRPSGREDAGDDGRRRLQWLWVGDRGQSGADASAAQSVTGYGYL